MIRIPKKGTPLYDRIVKEHEACIKSMKGVAGCSVLRCKTLGDTTEVSGGIHEDFVLNRVLLRMRAKPAKNKLVVICTKIEKEWRIGHLSGVRGVPPILADDRIFNDEQEVQHAIFLMRLEEMAESDGYPEHFHEGWKRRDDNWTAT